MTKGQVGLKLILQHIIRFALTEKTSGSVQLRALTHSFTAVRPFFYSSLKKDCITELKYFC